MPETDFLSGQVGEWGLKFCKGSPTSEGGFSYSHGQNNYKICVSVQCSIDTRKLIDIEVSILDLSPNRIL